MASAARSNEHFGIEQSGITLRSVRAARAAARKEAIARHLAGGSGDSASNYEAMVRALERNPNAGAMPCEDCDGLGFRQLARHVVEQFDKKLEARLLEIDRKTVKLREHLVNAASPVGECDDVGERFRRSEAVDADRVRGELLVLYENIEADQRERLKRAICRTCRGSAKSKRRRYEDRPGRPDSMFATTACPSCIGSDTRNHRRNADGEPAYPKLMHAHTGTSAGYRVDKMRGPRMVDADGNPMAREPADGEVYTVVSDPRDDAAADRGDVRVCKRCTVAENTPGYIAPITCRPTRKAGDVEEDLDQQAVGSIQLNGKTEEIGTFSRNGEEVSELERYPSDDFAEDAPSGDDDAAGWLDEVAAEDQSLAAACALLAGDRRDRECVLWPLTTSGRCLAEEAPGHRQGAGYERLLELCETELAEEREGVGRPRRRLLLGHVRREARLLKERAEARLGA